MKTQYNLLKFSAVTRLFENVIRLLSPLTFPHPPAPIPVPVSPRSSNLIYRRTAPRWRAGMVILALGVVSLVLSSASAWAGRPTLPAGVPNIFDPEVRAQYELVGVANLRGNPDFPVVLLLNTAEGKPEAVLVGLDARNGEETWSLENDPIILIVVFSDQTTIQKLYVDTGFADQGKASGNYAPVDEKDSPALPDMLKAVEISGLTAI